VTPLAYPKAEEPEFRTVYPAATCGHDPDEPYGQTASTMASSESNPTAPFGLRRPASSSSSSITSTRMTGKLEPTSRVAKLALNYQSKPITQGRIPGQKQQQVFQTVLPSPEEQQQQVFQTVPPSHWQSEGSNSGNSSKAGRRSFKGSDQSDKGKREFPSGEKIEYFSSKVHSWIPAKVMGRNTNGTYQLDCRRYASASKMRLVTAELSHIPPPPTPVAAKVSTRRRHWWLPEAMPTFKSGEVLEYYNRTRGGWVNSMVLGVNSDGTYRPDCKRKDLRPLKPTGGAVQTKALDDSLFQTRVPEGAFSTRLHILGQLAE